MYACQLRGPQRAAINLKKVCAGKCAAVLDTIVFTRGVKSVVANSDKDIVSDVQFGNAVPVSKTNRLNPAPEGEALVASNTVNFSGTDLRSLIMTRRNKRLAKLSEISTSGRTNVRMINRVYATMKKARCIRGGRGGGEADHTPNHEGGREADHKSNRPNVLL